MVDHREIWFVPVVIVDGAINVLDAIGTVFIFAEYGF
jgi:hypothetical protein